MDRIFTCSWLMNLCIVVHMNSVRKKYQFEVPHSLVEIEKHGKTFWRSRAWQTASSLRSSVSSTKQGWRGFDRRRCGFLTCYPSLAILRFPCKSIGNEFGIKLTLTMISTGKNRRICGFALDFAMEFKHCKTCTMHTDHKAMATFLHCRLSFTKSYEISVIFFEW